MAKQKRVLIVSSVPITHFGNLGIDRVAALENFGYEVDYLTKYQDENPHVIGVYPKRRNTLFLKSIKSVVSLRCLSFLKHWYSSLFEKNNYINKDGIIITNPDENCPAVDNNQLLSLIEPIYSFVYVLAWQDMITSSSLRAIYDKLHVPIIITTVDFQPITGGCYYFGKCRNFEVGCGNCPVLGGMDENDITRQNFLVKKENYNSMNCGFMVNPYSMEYVKRARLVSSNDRYQISYYSMDENLYKPLNRDYCRHICGINEEKKYVILSRFTSFNDKRKGYSYLVSAINSFASEIGARKNEILLLLVGGRDESFENLFNVDVHNLGYLNVESLIQAYSAADIFISSSVDDAGPSMVNQSIMCGTPVLSFNIGSALYLVDNDETGYIVKLRDVDSMTQSLVKHFNLTPEERSVMKNKCREKGVKTGSREIFARTVVDFAEKLSNLIYN